MKIILHIYAVLLTFICVDMSAQTTLALEKCREMALQNDPYVKNAGLDIYAAQAQQKEVIAEYFPKVSLNSFGFLALDPMLEIGVKLFSRILYPQVRIFRISIRHAACLCRRKDRYRKQVGCSWCGNSRDTA